MKYLMTVISEKYPIANWIAIGIVAIILIIGLSFMFAKLIGIVIFVAIVFFIVKLVMGGGK